MTFWIVLTIALFLTVIGLIAICLKKEKQNKNLLEQKPKWDTEIDRQKAELKNLQQSVEQFRNLAASERNDYDEAKKSRQNVIAENDKLFKAQQTQNAATLLEQTSQLKQLLAEIAAKNKEIEALDNQQTQLRQQATLQKAEIESLQQQMAMVKEQHSNATKRLVDENCGRTLPYTTKDLRLIELLDKVKDSYPELTKEIAGIEWKKVWMSAWQAMTDDLGAKTKVCGIYRIWTIDAQGKCRNYVGKATDIRDRWSDHIKKMIGAETPSAERLYKEVLPQDAHFEIIERTPSIQSIMDEREHYWIAYYNGSSDGYNIKQ